MAYQYKREPLSNDEATKLSNACDSPIEKLVIWTLLDTGLRRSELVGLTPKNLDWQTHRLTVKGKGGPFGKRSKVRVVPLSSRLQALLEHWFAIHDAIGVSARTVHRIIARVANRARILRPTSAHVLRHTFAVTAVQKGISLPALQRLLGHDNLTTTAIYLNLSPEHVIEEFRAKW